MKIYIYWLFNITVCLNLNLFALEKSLTLIKTKDDQDVQYTLGSITFKLIQQGIFDIPADAIVNAANEGCLGGGGIDGQFVKLGGSALADAREAIPEVKAGVRCPLTQARITLAGSLAYPDPSNPQNKIPFKYAVHAVGPDCRNFTSSGMTIDVTPIKIKQVADTYLNTITRIEAFNKNPKDQHYIEFSKIDITNFGKNYQIKSVTFPTISSGIFGCDTKFTANAIVTSLVNYFKQHISNDLQVIQFAFYSPGDSAKAIQDLNNFEMAFDSLLKPS